MLAPRRAAGGSPMRLLASAARLRSALRLGPQERPTPPRTLALDHPVERATVHAEDLGGVRLVPAEADQNALDVPALKRHEGRPVVFQLAGRYRAEMLWP